MIFLSSMWQKYEINIIRVLLFLKSETSLNYHLPGQVPSVKKYSGYRVLEWSVVLSNDKMKSSMWHSMVV